MANTSLQVCGFVVGLLGWGLAIMTTFMQAWRKNDLTGKNMFMILLNYLIEFKRKQKHEIIIVLSDC